MELTRVIQEVIDVLNLALGILARDPLDRQQFDRIIQGFYLTVIDAEGRIDAQLAGDRDRKRQLRGAYTAAIRALIARAAQLFGEDEATLYRLNRGRIPMWAWQTPHHEELGITTPIAENRGVPALGTDVEFSVNGFDIVIAVDVEDPSLGSRGHTRIDFDWGPSVTFQEAQGSITSFAPNPPPTPRVRIQTFYGPQARGARVRQDYGRGTTAEDVAGGAISPASRSVPFHEGMHGLDYVEFLESHPPPQFGGRTGMTVAQFQTAAAQWANAHRAYAQAIARFTLIRTECVGFTIDQWRRANAAPGQQVTILCP